MPTKISMKGENFYFKNKKGFHLPYCEFLAVSSRLPTPQAAIWQVPNKY